MCFTGVWGSHRPYTLRPLPAHSGGVFRDHLSGWCLFLGTPIPALCSLSKKMVGPDLTSSIRKS